MPLVSFPRLASDLCDICGDIYWEIMALTLVYIENLCMYICYFMKLALCKQGFIQLLSKYSLLSIFECFRKNIVHFMNKRIFYGNM